MCLQTKFIISPKREISLYGGQFYRIPIKCGKCAECMKEKQDEYMFRSYYECLWTFQNNGFVYFDTLTYAPKNLPMMSDFVPELKGRLTDHSCFNTEHYRMFFVKLREYMARLGYESQTVKYFLSSEYGVDDRYTHAPHYHVLFFVTADIDPLEFSRLVNKAWIYGRTDGIDWKSKDYVMNHVFVNDEKKSHILNIVNYVAKYVTKSSPFEKSIDNRLRQAKIKILNGYHISIDEGDDIDDLFSKYVDNRDKEKFKKLRKQMLQFHRQSQQFGAAFPLYNDMDKVLETGMISMPDKNNIVKHMPIPGYYARKLFYDLVEDAEGKKEWEINELGITFKLSHSYKNIDRQVQKFGDWHENMVRRYIGPKQGEVDDVDKWYRDHLNEFDKLLGDRSIKDFVIYLLFYKGRIKPDDGNYELSSFVMRQFSPVQKYYKIKYNYSHHTYKKIFGDGKFITDKDLGDRSKGLSLSAQNFALWSDMFEASVGFRPSLLKATYSPITKLDRFGEMLPCEYFAYKYVINDTTLPEWHDFDKMWNIYVDSLEYKNKGKQEVHDLKEDLKFRLQKYWKKY